MKVIEDSGDRLVLGTHRRIPGVLNILGAPVVYALGRKIAEDGPAWFGGLFVGLALAMLVGGIWVLFLRIELAIDRPRNLVRFSHKGLFRHSVREMALGDLDRVELRTVSIGNNTHAVLDILPKAGSGAETLTIREFWSEGSAGDAAWAIDSWMIRVGLRRDR